MSKFHPPASPADEVRTDQGELRKPDDRAVAGGAASRTPRGVNRPATRPGGAEALRTGSAGRIY